MENRNDLEEIMKSLKTNKGNLTRQQFNTLKGQAFSGDVAGAGKGLNKLLERSGG